MTVKLDVSEVSARLQALHQAAVHRVPGIAREHRHRRPPCRRPQRDRSGNSSPRGPPFDPSALGLESHKVVPDRPRGDLRLRQHRRARRHSSESSPSPNSGMSCRPGSTTWSEEPRIARRVRVPVPPTSGTDADHRHRPNGRRARAAARRRGHDVHVGSRDPDRAREMADRDRGLLRRQLLRGCPRGGGDPARSSLGGRARDAQPARRLRGRYPDRHHEPLQGGQQQRAARAAAAPRGRR